MTLSSSPGESKVQKERIAGRPLLLDLFCGAGGAAMGYARAGFDVIGVDINPQPNYPFRFEQGDALDYLREEIALPARKVDAVHASPPCQRFSSMRRGRWQDREHPDLVGPTRELLRELGVPYVIENVVGAPLLDPVVLCGTMFGLASDFGNELRRHRLFECRPPIQHALRCQHNGSSTIGVYGGGQHPSRRTRRYDASQEHDDFGIAQRRKAMGIEWMTGRELNQSIPPAYTEYIGRQLFAHVAQQRAAA